MYMSCLTKEIHGGVGKDERELTLVMSRVVAQSVVTGVQMGLITHQIEITTLARLIYIHTER